MGAFVRDLILDEVKVPCPCEGTPHDEDIVYIKHALNGMEHARIQGAIVSVNAEGTAYADVAAGNLLQVRTYVQGWTFVDEEGKRIPFNPDDVDYLRADIWQRVYDETEKHETQSAAPKENLNSGTGTSDTTPIKPLTSGSSETLVSSPSYSIDSQDSDLLERFVSSKETPIS